MANRRVKQTKIWDSGHYSAHMEVTFDVQFLVFGLGPFGALCKISNLNFQFLKHCSSPNFQLIHPSIIQGILITPAITFLAICQKLKKKYDILKFFLPQNYMQVEIQSAISDTIFIGVIQTL